MSGQYGVKESKEFFDLGFALVNAGKGVLADGKVSIGDIAYVIPVLPAMEAGLVGLSIVPKELGELDEADEKELLDYAKAKLPQAVSDEKLRVKVYAYVKAGVALAHAYAVSREG